MSSWWTWSCDDESGVDLRELCPRTEDVGAGVKGEEKPNSANLKTLIFNGDFDCDDYDGNCNDDDDDGDDYDSDDDDNLQDHVHLSEARKAFVPDWSQKLLNIGMRHKLHFVFNMDPAHLGYLWHNYWFYWKTPN